MGRKIKAAILVIGNEILSGKTQDQNVQYLAQQLSDLGIILAEVRIVLDIGVDIIDAINILRHKYDYVFSTGGIGPTHDDITAAAVAKAFGVTLERNQLVVRLIDDHYKERGMVAHKMSYRMADMPQGASLVINSISGAPGFSIENVYVFAGVPNIMRSMFERIKLQLKTGAKFITEALVVSSSESRIAEMLGVLNLEYSMLNIGSYPFQKDGKWGIHLVIRGQNMFLVEEALTKLQNYLILENIEFQNAS